MTFEDEGLRGGIWTGQLHAETAPDSIALLLAGETIATADLTAAGEGAWRVQVALPPDCLSDGAVTLQLAAQRGRQTEVLASLPIIAGRVVEADLRAEIALMRAEIDLLKRELRRLGENG